MIDTIKIRLPLKDGRYKNDNQFYPLSLSDLFYSSKVHIQTKYNPSKTIGIYAPTYIGEKFITNGYACCFLSIEMSLPKLLYGNNIEELTPRSETFSDITDELESVLYRDLGLEYSEEEIQEAQVAKLHIGKNFIFDDPGAPLFIIDTIYKSRADRMRMDNRTKYENLGSSFRVHTNNKEMVYYDKKKDLEQSLKSPKQAIDGSFTDDIREEGSPICEFLSDKSSGVLRLEVRLNNRKYIKKAFPSISEDLSFKNVFLNAPIMSYLEKEWHNTTKDISMVQLGKESLQSVFETIAANKTYGLSLRDSLAVAAAAEIINDRGVNYLRSLVEKHYNRDSWYRLKKKITIPECYHPSYFKKVEEELQIYNPIILRDV